MVSSYDMQKWQGRFREGPVYVVQEQTGDIVHEGANATDVPELIARLGATLTESQRANGDLLLSAATAHLNFVLVHPFKDGNGRMARILQSLVLAEVGQGNWHTANYDPELARPGVRFILTEPWNQALELNTL